MNDGTPTPQEPLSETQALLDFVAQREVPCPRCGYNLRGLTQPACPECGDKLKLTVGSLSPMNRAWLTMLSALLMPAGIGAIICVVVIMSLQHFGWGDLMPGDAVEAFGILVILYAVACIPMSIAAIVLRRPFSRLPRGAQTVAAITPVLIDISSFVFFLVMIS